MGEWLGVPEWLAVTAFVIGGLAIWLTRGFVMLRRAHRRVAARRPNPTDAEFFAMMAQDCSPEAARFVWQQALIYIAPRLTPHPDDHLLDDLCIDDDDIDTDWVSEWADQRGVLQKTLPDWPKDWPLTVRNFARWLDLVPASAAA
ncbi:hypothetical protein [Erythrobacter neustonensis]|uniref:Uncharacterized protein n=1 Tax=Erythrobacter neustonensis TaxID=1112 RepID=A0A192D387_9SPHN|nr:hypothetical protein [Erythrobacter neustonensis]ANK12392.1 hypothetical protein A9D12_04900 [Erythrobacter neustonensis]